MSPTPPPVDMVELDDQEMSTVDGGTSLPCATAVVTTLTTCFSDTVLWGSCRMGTRGCC
ncbi:MULTISPECIES: chromosome condensation protein CrcB [Actinomyces]|uniref:Chromosome condensation protein CrcB n=1 Tax=Actinomyces respiraculi TaxID=2744574 RepID=A0A7T0LKQ6_9ACTO|nr:MULTISPECIES: chromosome condensation protein CrcB [Actinomyces]QPL05569.1 chromosome condensation protein CrcB [Actinomyces respiraculi]